MKTITLLTLTLPLLSLEAFAAAPTKCANISGKYRPAYESTESDLITTMDISQEKCDWLMIGGHFVSAPGSYSPRAHVFDPKNFYLDGSTAPKNCGWNSFYGICGTYKAEAKFITKTVDAANEGAVADPVHGGCFFTVSRLWKDGAGNLVEEPQDAKCEDGFSGVVAPMVHRKAVGK